MNNALFENVKRASGFLAIVLLGLITSCSNEDPVKQDVPEFISSVKLIFAPIGGGSEITATATDPDGLGSADIKVSGPVHLVKNVSYNLSFEILNNLAAPTDPEYNIGDEIEKEG